MEAQRLIPAHHAWDSRVSASVSLDDLRVGVGTPYYLSHLSA